MISKKRFMNLMAKYAKYDYRVSLRIDMEPAYKQGDRSSVVAGHVHHYQPAWITDAEAEAKRQILEQLPKGFEMFDVPVNVGVTFVTASPKLPKWWTDGMIAVPDFTKPDDSQYWKWFGDCLDGTVVKNDSRFCITTIRKKHTLDENLYGKPGVYCNVFVDDHAVAMYRRLLGETNSEAV